MARRNRRAARPARRQVAPESHAPTHEPARDAPRDATRGRARGRLVPAGASLAVGEASPALERAAAVERGFVVKDFRRLGLTVAAMLALLAASGFVVNALFP